MSRTTPNPTGQPATPASISQVAPDRADRGPSTASLRRADLKPMAAAKTPVGPGVISLVGIILALQVVAVGVVAAQTALVASGVLSGNPWLTTAVTAVNGLSPAVWMLPVGIVVALLGLWLVITALKPRPRTGVALQATTGVFLRPRDLARLATSAADDVDGVQDARASATRTKVTVHVTTTGSEDTVADAVKNMVAQRLSALNKPVRVTVRTSGGRQ